MKTKDFLIVALAPLAVLLIPFIGMRVSDGWKWTGSDFVVAWCILAVPVFLYRLLATRKTANLAYRLGAGLALGAGFFITWVNLAVQIIGDDNPGNLLYFGVILAGLVGVGASRFQAAHLARVAYTMAAALFLIPIVSVLFWPADFSPGPLEVFILNFCFVLAFTVAGLLFRAASQGPSSVAHTPS